jgi:acetyl-CoA carboxylase biotin carboxylase subunit
MTALKKILIANRGEIAVRVARACKDAGPASVAVYSDPDRTALHVRAAKEAYPLHGTTSAETYLVQEKIVETAKACRATAIHPGYGFLSENHAFAAFCEKKGIIFIGPPAEVIRLLGDKLEAREKAKKAGLPLAPASTQQVDKIDNAKAEAKKIGYPILIKAAAGGGGKGMRIVNDASELKASLTTAASEAKSAFGDKRVYLEKYIARPRHIEIQIMADSHGTVVHLGERECSIQRRHQKVIEESPSTVVDDKLRARMGDAAVAIAREAGYVGAGTVEFLVDEDLNFYFLEVNARLQVEHPVTELVTGIDLVREQFRVAEGKKLSFGQKDIARRGHAIECRIYAEDAAAGFVPSTGHLSAYVEPSGPGVRIDSGFSSGDAVPVYYDPLISKLCTFGIDRNAAITRMRRALSEYLIHGVETTIPFGLLVMENRSFAAGDLSTHFITEQFPELGASLARGDDQLAMEAMAAAVIDFRRQEQLEQAADYKRHRESNWKSSGRAAAMRQR